MRSANAQFETCVALAREHGLGRPEIANLPMVGWSSLHLMDAPGAVAIGSAAIELAVRASQPRAELLARGLVGWVDGVMRGAAESARQQSDAGLELARRLGASRFETQHLCVSALIAARADDGTRARELAAQALAITQAHGMSHIGPTTLGVCALVETDPDVRRRLLAEGEAELGRDCTSHNYLWLREFAIDVMLDLGDWEGVEQNCGRLVAYTADEPLPTTTFVVERGRALARVGRGDRGDALHAVLTRLDEMARNAELNVARQAIRTALDGFAPRPPVNGG